MRIEVYYKNPGEDGRTHRLEKALAASGFEINGIVILDIYFPASCSIDAATASRLLSDGIAQNVVYSAGEESPFAAENFSWDTLVEVSYKPGVTDPVGLTASKTIELELGAEAARDLSVETARQYLLSYRHGREKTASVNDEIAKEFYNPLIQQAVCIEKEEWLNGVRPPLTYSREVPPSSVEVEHIQLESLSDSELESLSRERLLALSREEMRAVRNYYSDEAVLRERVKRDLPTEATDVELEIIAQTWSEHCKHKIFAADIAYRDNENATERISSLFSTYIKKCTDELEPKKNFLRSVFHDNSGVVQFHDDYCLCFKVETHNSPSALDPYGGAITGIVGVNRDILGTGKGALPIFNTNVLCFGELDMPKEDLPEGLLHPKKIMHGVHQGIIDGGNQSGIPVVGGGFLFDESFTGKPLVFCGTGGILPARLQGEESWIKHIESGDLALMVGGRIGKDGIHGATFSSQELNEDSPTSAVQIGDPITQKKMIDFLLEARDRGLYKGITDNGAGGLSSSIGEMALDSGGARVYLEKCPLKYSGLAPWEIFVSESQERMSLAVSKKTLEEFLALAKQRDVEAAVIGEFTDTGFLEIFHESQPIGSLHLDFLHNGLPKMNLEAVWIPPEREDIPVPETDGEALRRILLDILREPNVASKEQWVRQYDHEVRGGSILKPFCGLYADGPSDGAVVKPHYHFRQGITVTHGICPRFGDIDTYHMAMCAVDEAYRAHIALGGDPEKACALDNFCWPDPVRSEQTPDGAYKCAQLVRACKGLYDACSGYEIPLISGKDSMKNDARIGKRKVSIRPTLLISLMGLVPDIDGVVSSDFKKSGDIVYLLGETRDELGGTIFEKCTGRSYREVPKVDIPSARLLYAGLHEAIRRNLLASCHDCADGGAAVALVESAIGGRNGVRVDFGGNKPTLSNEAILFSETPSRFVVSVSPDKTDEFEGQLASASCLRIGVVSAEREILFTKSGKELIRLDLEESIKAWKPWE